MLSLALMPVMLVMHVVAINRVHMQVVRMVCVRVIVVGTSDGDRVVTVDRQGSGGVGWWWHLQHGASHSTAARGACDTHASLLLQAHGVRRLEAIATRRPSALPATCRRRVL